MYFGFLRPLFVVAFLLSAEGDEFLYRSLYIRVPQSFLKAMPLKVFENATVEECSRLCVTEVEFECKSFDFENGLRECHLHNHTHTEPTIGLQRSLLSDHYRTAYEKLFNRIPNHVLTMKHNRNIRGLSVEECARRCILELDFNCRGFDYETKRRNCWLTDKAPPDIGGLKLRINTDFYERKSNGPLSQFINYGYGSLHTIEGVQIHNKNVLGVNLDACAQLCLAEISFACVSFDYVFDEQSCQMSQYIAANVHGMRTEFHEQQKIMHYELIKEYLAHFYPTPYASVLGNNDRTLKKVTPNTCARKCLEEREFVCRSFDYQIQDGTCLLSHVTGSDAGGLYSPAGVHVHHFEMKPVLDCGNILTEERGMFASPNWPRHYSHHLNCSWSISVPKFKVIRLDIVHLDLGEQSENPCDVTRDVLAVIEQGRQPMCIENHVTELTSLTNNVTVRFTTNAENDAQGFRIFYSSDWPCNKILTEDQGEIASPRWPAKYPAMTLCSWTIQAPKHSNIYIRFNSVSLEDHIGSNCRTAYDKLEVYDGNTASSPRLKRFCGHSRSVSFKSSSNVLYIQFSSDSRVQAEGFHASYRFLYHTTSTTTTTTTTSTITPQVPTSSDILSETDSTETYSQYTADTIGKTDSKPGSANMSESINMALKGLTEKLMPLFANFIEPASKYNQATQSDHRNTTVHEIGITGDDTGVGPAVTYEDEEAGMSLEAVLWGVVLAVVSMVLVIISAICLLCLYRRRRSPKRRPGSNMPISEENVSLCDKLEHDQQRPLDEEDIAEEAMLPLPSSHDPPADIEFLNPLYTKRHCDSDDQHEDKEHVLPVQQLPEIQPGTSGEAAEADMTSQILTEIVV